MQRLVAFVEAAQPDQLGMLVRPIEHSQVAPRLVQPPAPDCSNGERVRSYIGNYIDFIWEDPERAQLFDCLDNNPLITYGDATAIFDPFVLSMRGEPASVDRLAQYQVVRVQAFPHRHTT